MKNQKKILMFRIVSYVLISMTGLVMVSCSGNSSNKAVSQKDSAAKNGSSKTESGTNNADLSVVATEACDCISDFENALGDQAKELVIQASKNGGMDTVTRSFSDKDKEVWSTEGTKARNCLKLLEKKYPSIKKSPAGYKKSLEENCSEFAAALVD